MILHETLGATFLARAKSTPEKVAIRVWRAETSRFDSFTYGQLQYESHYVSHGLSQLGVQAEDRVAVICQNRFEWLVCDLAILGAKAIPVAISPRSTRDDLLLILRNCAPSALFIENVEVLNLVLELRTKDSEAFRNLKAVVLLDLPQAKPVDTMGDSLMTSFAALRQFGEENDSDSKSRFEANLKDADPETIATIAYTQGTTGNPKGVLLTHRSLVSILRDMNLAMGRFIHPETDLVFSILDSSKILTRAELYAGIAFGWTRLYSSQVGTTSIPSLQPSILFSGTHFLEDLFRKSNPHNGAPNQGVFSALMRRLRENPFADILLRNPVRAQIGDSLRLILCAGSPLSAKIVDFFATSGVTLLSGYGSTETSGTIALNTPDAFRLGSAGRPLPEVSIRIAEDGEILVKSEKLFAGYSQQDGVPPPIVDGWLKTGDAGRLDSDGFLYVLDRKRALIQLESGLKAAPSRYEHLARLNPLIEDLYVFGEGQAELGALVTLNRDRVLDFATKNQVFFTAYSDLLRSPKVLFLVQQGIEEINSELSDSPPIRRFLVLSEPFGLETGELTRSRRQRRSAIENRYRGQIESLYQRST